MRRSDNPRQKVNIASPLPQFVENWLREKAEQVDELLVAHHLHIRVSDNCRFHRISRLPETRPTHRMVIKQTGTTNMAHLDGMASDPASPSGAADELGVFTYDIKKDLVFADAAVAALFGLDAGEAKTGLPIGRFADAVHPDDRIAFVRDIASRGAEASFEHHYRTLRPDGLVQNVKAFGKCFADRDGSPLKQSGLVLAEDAPVRRTGNRLLDLCLEAHAEAEAAKLPMVAYMLSMVLLDLGFDFTKN